MNNNEGFQRHTESHFLLRRSKHSILMPTVLNQETVLKETFHFKNSQKYNFCFASFKSTSSKAHLRYTVADCSAVGKVAEVAIQSYTEENQCYYKPKE